MGLLSPGGLLAPSSRMKAGGAEGQVVGLAGDEHSGNRLWKPLQGDRTKGIQSLGSGQASPRISVSNWLELDT